MDDRERPDGAGYVDFNGRLAASPGPQAVADLRTCPAG